MLERSPTLGWFETQEKLNQQGDGIKAFCAILIPLIGQLTPLILLDEPEAFLHPPQIRELARIIATEIYPHTQVIIATHSDDFVRGMIDFAGRRVSVIRMTRSKFNDGQSREVNYIKKLDSADISQLWHDPLLRTSDVLTSLFHRLAIIVEGDSDARFLRALLDKIADNDSAGVLDVKFFHCGGKDKIPKIVAALRAIGVPTVCVVDIDVLDDKEKFLRLVDSFGGDRSTFEKPIADLLRFVSEQRSTQNFSETKEQIEKLFEGLDTQKPIPSNILLKVREVLNRSSAWYLVKRSGASFFPGGEAYNNFTSICNNAGTLGIVINTHGELENLCRTVVAKKGEWLTAVLEKDLSTDADLLDARQFAQNLLHRCQEIAASKITRT